MVEGSSELRDFITELKRRHVFRVAALYAVVAFVVLQVADIAFPALGLSDRALTVVVLLAILGFPIALVLGWAFDVTPEGLRRTAPLAVGIGRSARARRLLAITAVIVVVALSVGAGWYVLAVRPSWIGVADGGRAPAAAGARKMLVVLPFENLGPASRSFFADGITEEVTARLAAMDGLGVIARTNAMQYRGTAKTVEQIGRELGVDYVLEGTVRWETAADGSSRVRVTPQLVRVSDATHVWSEIYEEPLASVFEVQSEIAEQVARAMDVTLLEPERQTLAARPTENVEAFQYFVLGNEYLASSATEVGAIQAMEMYERAIELDPDFELVYAKLNEVHANFYWAKFRTAIGLSETAHPGRIAELSPSGFGADTAAFYLARAILGDRAGDRAARADYDSARAVAEGRLQARPQEPRSHAQLGLAYAGLGRPEKALRHGVRATELLSLSRDAFAGAAWADNLAHIYVKIGDDRAAIEQLAALLTVPTPVSVAWLRVDPTWDPLRDRPGFQRLLAGNR